MPGHEFLQIIFPFSLFTSISFVYFSKRLANNVLSPSYFFFTNGLGVYNELFLFLCVQQICAFLSSFYKIKNKQEKKIAVDFILISTQFLSSIAKPTYYYHDWYASISVRVFYGGTFKFLRSLRKKEFLFFLFPNF